MTLKEEKVGKVQAMRALDSKFRFHRFHFLKVREAVVLEEKVQVSRVLDSKFRFHLS